ncbi:MAG: hypothetical protein RR702_00845 [Clostridia bacterium]
MSTQIKLKRGLDANVAALSLEAGEPAFVTDTGKLYVGDGKTKVLINPVNKPAGLDTSTSYTKVKVNEYGQVVALANILATDLPPIPASNITGLGSAALANTGTESGNVPILDASGKLSDLVLPSLAITNTFVVASEAEMLALKAEVGDVAVRTDTNENYILKSSPASAISSWIKLLVPVDAVTSVNGKTGTVVLIPSDLLMTGYTKATSYSPILPTDNASVAIGKLDKHFDSYAPLESPAFVGTPTSTVPSAGDNSNKVATTSYIKTELINYAPINSPIFTGSPVSTTPATADSSTRIATTAFVKANLEVIDGGTF